MEEILILEIFMKDIGSKEWEKGRKENDYGGVSFFG